LGISVFKLKDLIMDRAQRSAPIEKINTGHSAASGVGITTSQ
jgi:hypothetical protein